MPRIVSQQPQRWSANVHHLGARASTACSGLSTLVDLGPTATPAPAWRWMALLPRRRRLLMHRSNGRAPSHADRWLLLENALVSKPSADQPRDHR